MPIQLTTVDGKKFALDGTYEDQDALKHLRNRTGPYNGAWVRVAGATETWINLGTVTVIRVEDHEILVSQG